MESEIQQFIADFQKPINKFTIKELRKREEITRALWSWLDDEVKYYLVRVGSTLRLVGRDYKGRVGELGSVKFKVDELEVIVYEKVYNYNDGKYYWEDKVLKINDSTIAWKEFILTQANVEEDLEPSLGDDRTEESANIMSSD